MPTFTGYKECTSLPIKDAMNVHAYMLGMRTMYMPTFRDAENEHAHLKGCKKCVYETTYNYSKGQKLKLVDNNKTNHHRTSPRGSDLGS